MDLNVMEKEPLSFKYNTCRVDVQVAGMDAIATGFIYATRPGYDYNYVLTAKHTFQEEDEPPCYSNLSKLEIRWKDKTEKLIPYRIEDKRLEKEIVFFDDFDLAIVRIPKHLPLQLKRVYVKNIVEVALDSALSSDSFLSIQRKESTRLGYCLKDKSAHFVNRPEAGYDGKSSIKDEMKVFRLIRKVNIIRFIELPAISQCKW